MCNSLLLLKHLLNYSLVKLSKIQALMIKEISIKNRFNLTNWCC